MRTTYPALLFLIIGILLTGDAYGNTQLKRPLEQKSQTPKNIGAYSHSKKVAQVFRPPTKKERKRNQWTRKKIK